MVDELVLKIETSDIIGANELARAALDPGNALNVHDSLFSVVQRVVNPPFMNPHLPKMYRVCRELFPYLEPVDVPGLVALEINEYARRPKLDPVGRVPVSVSRPSFADVEDAVGQREPAKVAALLDALQKEQGMGEMARQVLLLASGYMARRSGTLYPAPRSFCWSLSKGPTRTPGLLSRHWPTISARGDSAPRRSCALRCPISRKRTPF